jgi:anion-transporting  ArsA/GET3 family ATPase
VPVTGGATRFDKRLLIYSGKGGAGKSTVTAAAAVAAARQGKRVLVVEIGERERIPAIFGAPVAGYGGAPVYTPRETGAPAIWSMCLTARDALREFAMRSVKFDMVYGAVFENKLMRYFTAAAPGLDELTIMGKIESLHREVMEPEKGGRFDLMLFDAPATGHGLAFFKVPQMAMRMARSGPLYAMVERMWRLLSDPARTALNIVTLPEEMPVNESIDLHRAAEELGLPRGELIVNGVYPDVFGAAIHALQDLHVDSRVARAVADRARSQLGRRREHERMIAILEDRLPHRRVLLPYVFSPAIGPAEIEMLADYFPT